MTTTELDATKLEAFGGRMLGLLNDALLSILVSIAHQTGLYDSLAEMAPATSGEIAEASGLDERYVREWAAAMTVGGILEYKPGAETYFLPPEHAAFLARAAGSNNMAFLARLVGLSGTVEPELVQAFHDGRGVPYEKYPDFQLLQAEESGSTFDEKLVEVILPLAGVVERLGEGIDVLDVGCGAGHAVNVMARAFPATRFTGVDVSEEGLELARTEAAGLALENVRFEVRNVHELAAREAYDLVTAFDVVHDLAHPGRALEQLAAALRPGGTFLLGEIAAASTLEGNLENPFAPLLYSMSVIHCMSVSLAQDGEGHGTAWGRENALAALGAAGLVDVEAKELEDDPFHTFFVARKG